SVNAIVQNRSIGLAESVKKMKRNVLFRLLAVVLLAGGGETQAAEPAATNSLSLDSVVSEVLSNNPSLKAARANWEAMKERIPQARAWEDARVGVDVERMGTTRFDTFTDNEWMAAQELPLSGKNRKRGQAAVAEA